MDNKSPKKYTMKAQLITPQSISYDHMKDIIVIFAQLSHKRFQYAKYKKIMPYFQTPKQF